MKLFARRLQDMQAQFEQQQAINLELQRQLVAGSSGSGSDEEEQKAALELIKARDRATATTLYDGSAPRQVAAMSNRSEQDRVAGAMDGLPIDSMGREFGGGDGSSSQVSQFLGSYAEPDTAYGQRIARPDLTVGKGEIITVLNDTAINTEQPGMVRGRVTSDVWSMDMGCILIPAGSKVISEARSGVQAGGERIAVVGVTIRTPAPDFVTININSMAADGVGRSGIPSEVDRKTAARFGLAILTSMLPSGGDSIFSSSTSVAEEILKETLKTNPTADVPHSSIETTIFLARDLRLPKCYK
jgi:type IV secretion system protein VirB10